MEITSRFDARLDLKNPWVKGVVDTIRPGSRVLELYPGVGALTRHLREQLNCEVCVVEPNRQALASAAPYADKALNGGAEELDWERILRGRGFDYILLRNVLEQCADPASVLRRTIGLLKEGGQLLVTFYNGAYMGVALDLLQGRVDYAETGAAGRENLRFLTGQGMRGMLVDAGLQPALVQGYPLELAESEFAAKVPALPPEITHYVEDLPEAKIYQYFIVAVKESFYNLNKALFNPAFLEPERARFSTGLYLDKGSGFKSAEKLKGIFLEPGDSNVSFEIPEGGKVKGVRWAPVADRCFHCSGALLVGGGLSLHPDSGNADAHVEGTDFFLEPGGYYDFSSPEMKPGKYTIFYTLEVDYTGDAVNRAFVGHRALAEKEALRHSQELDDVRLQLQQKEEQLREQEQETRQALQLADQNEAGRQDLRTDVFGMVSGVQRMMRRKTSEVQQAQSENRRLSGALAQHTARERELEAELAQMKATRSWRLTKPFRWLASLGSTPPQPEEELDSVLLPAGPGEDEGLPTLEKRVSLIVWATQPDIEEQMALLRTQKGLQQMDIVLVGDAAALEGLENEGVTLVEAEEEAGILLSGAHSAAGDLFIFLMPGASPSGAWWARRVLEPFRDDEVVAATMQETPGPGTGLYEQSLMYARNHALFEEDGLDRIASYPPGGDEARLRRNADLGGAAFAVRADTFTRLELRDAEDMGLELGVQLLQDGGKIAFLGSEQVVCACGHPASYYLQRGFRRSEQLDRLFPASRPVGPTQKELLARVIKGYVEWRQLKDYLDYRSFGQAEEGISHLQIADYLDFMQCTQFSEGIPASPPPSGDARLDGFLNQVWALHAGARVDGEGMLTEYREYLDTGLAGALEQLTPDEPDVAGLIGQGFLDYFAARTGRCLQQYLRDAVSVDALNVLAEGLKEGGELPALPAESGGKKKAIER